MLEIEAKDADLTMRPTPEAFRPDSVVQIGAYYVSDDALPYWVVRADYDTDIIVDAIYYLGNNRNGETLIASVDEEVAITHGGGGREFVGTDSTEAILDGYTVVDFVAAGRASVETLIEDEG